MRTEEIVSSSPSPESGEVILISGHIGESHDDLLPRHQGRDCLESGDWAQRNFGKQRQWWQLGLPSLLQEMLFLPIFCIYTETQHGVFKKIILLSVKMTRIY